MKKLKCIVCGKEYPKPKYNKTRSHYCSETCRNKFYNRKYQAYRTEQNRLKKIEEAKISSPDKIQCLICGGWYRKVGSHVWNSHKMTAREYRKLVGLDVKRGLLTDKAREVMREHVFENGTVNNLKAGEINWFKKGQKGVGVYERSPQTLERLKNLNKFKKINKKNYD